MSRVIVIQDPPFRDVDRVGFDFTPAEEFGMVEVLAPNGKHILTPDVFRKMLDQGLADFDPDDDFIITTGDYSVLFFVGMILGKRFGRVRILRWVPNMKAYQPLLLDVR